MNASIALGLFHLIVFVILFRTFVILYYQTKAVYLWKRKKNRVKSIFSISPFSSDGFWLLGRNAKRKSKVRSRKKPYFVIGF